MTIKSTGTLRLVSFVGLGQSSFTPDYGEQLSGWKRPIDSVTITT